MRSVKRVENNVRGRRSAMDIESKFPQIILIVFMILQLALALLPIFITVNLSFKDAVVFRLRQFGLFRESGCSAITGKRLTACSDTN